ncbi:glycosyltransferase family 2 protein [Clostridium massiliamazoniense]|uniref:glycosyltransferase family 2 protein n=1 Tax=Clostridium massiliamazoniense TaxID=1347366 RepID=UPI0006D80E97|nr:glycosyltransferase family 2 protein [Clostridium massiliamazoniense]
MEKFLSIIIPMYNSADHINKTLESLNNENDIDFEIILVDDGSTDDSIAVAENYLNTMKVGYKILKEQHKGQSHARNKGIENAKGKYILFLDSDDFINGNLVEVIKKNILEDTEILVYDYLRVDKNYVILENKEQKFDYKEGYHFGIDIFNAYKNNELRLWTGALVYSREFLLKNNLKFLEGAYAAEDLNFIFKALFKSNNVKVIKDVLVYYYQRKDSLTNKPDILKNITVIDSFEDVVKYIKSNSLSIDLVNSIEKEFIPEHIMYQICGALTTDTKSQVKEALRKSKARQYLKAMNKESTRYGKSVYTWAKMASMMPGMFMNIYINKAGKK